MEWKEFIERQKEFVGKKIEVILKWKDGTIHRMRRVVPFKNLDPNNANENFEIVGVEIL